MRLFSSSTSPFVAKVRMVAHHCGIPLTVVATDTGAEPSDLLAANPLGKIPALILDGGEALYDSRVICEYFDRLSGRRLLPQTDEEWRFVKRMEATADGVVDAAVLSIYEVRYRPEDKRHQPWVDKQMRKAWRGLDSLEATVSAETADLTMDDLTVADFALAGLLGWLDLRFKGQWETGHPALVAWLQRFPTRFPAYDELKPRV